MNRREYDDERDRKALEPGLVPSDAGLINAGEPPAAWTATSDQQPYWGRVHLLIRFLFPLRSTKAHRFMLAGLLALEQLRHEQRLLAPH